MSVYNFKLPPKLHTSQCLKSRRTQVPTTNFFNCYKNNFLSIRDHFTQINSIVYSKFLLHKNTYIITPNAIDVKKIYQNLLNLIFGVVVLLKQLGLKSSDNFFDISRIKNLNTKLLRLFVHV